jgi:hypothetical protein
MSVTFTPFYLRRVVAVFRIAPESIANASSFLRFASTTLEPIGEFIVASLLERNRSD